MTPEVLVAQRIRKWFQRWFASCAFAAHLAEDKQIVVIVESDPPNTEKLARFLDGVAASEKVAVIAFPLYATAADVMGLLNTLQTPQRWQVARSPQPNAAPPGAVALTVGFLTQSKHWSNVMGLAPLGTMPATRRAPYVALVAWPGRPRRACLPVTAGSRRRRVSSYGA